MICDKYMINYHVVDIGGGQGHLARYLSMLYDIPVTCIEGSKHNSDKATEFDNNFICKNLKSMDKNVMKPSHKAIYLERNMDDNYWDSVTNNNMFDKKCEYLLNGLHCCGELAPTMIEMFCQLSNCTAMVLTSCCYHKMKVESQPMSSVCKVLLNETKLSYVILESACHFLYEYTEKLKLANKNNSNEIFESQIFRATFQEIVSNRGMTHKICKNKMKTKKYPIDYSVEHRFELYASDLLNKYGIFPSKLTVEEQCLAKLRINDNWKHVIIFHCLRLMIGPAIETFLLVDRVLYLRENNIEANIYQIFDATLSPRNSAIVALKR